MTEATITIEDLGENTKVAHISGQLDESNVDEKIQEIYKVVEQIPKGLNLILDFENLEYMNSKSIGYVTDLYGKITEASGTIAIAAAKPNIIDILQVVGLTQLIKTFDTVKLAQEGSTAAAPAAATPAPTEAAPETPTPEAEAPTETKPEAAEPTPEAPAEPEAPATPEAPAAEASAPEQPTEPTAETPATEASTPEPTAEPEMEVKPAEEPEATEPAPAAETPATPEAEAPTETKPEAAEPTPETPTGGPNTGDGAYNFEK